MEIVEAFRQQIGRLNRIGIALSAEHNLDALLELIVREARGFCQADAGSLYIVEGDQLHFLVSQNDTLAKRPGAETFFKAFHFPIDRKSIAGYVALTGETLNLPDVYEIPPDCEYQFNKEPDRKNAYRSQSMLVVPMRDHRDSIIGVLQLINALDGEGRIIPFREEYESLVLSLASQAAVSIQNARHLQEIERWTKGIIEYSAAYIDAKDHCTEGHSRRIALYAVTIARHINAQTSGPFKDVFFTDEELEELNYAGWLHDVGKIAIPDRILVKQNKLTDEKIEAITARFQYVKKALEAEAWKKKMDLALRPHPSDAALKAVDAELAAATAELDQDLQLIFQKNRPGFVNDAEVERLQAIARKTYRDPEGKEMPLLTAEELENLVVRRGNLTAEERKIMESHVVHTGVLLEKIPFPERLKDVPGYAAVHHEMLDGSGYPKGIKADQLPLQGRILAVVDIFEALTALDRPYKPPMPVEKAIAILKEEVDRGRLDGDIVGLFIREKIYEEVLLEAFGTIPGAPPQVGS